VLVGEITIGTSDVAFEALQAPNVNITRNPITNPRRQPRKRFNVDISLPDIDINKAPNDGGSRQNNPEPG